MNNATVNRIIKMYKEGKEVKDIAESLGISENAVLIVIKGVFKK